MNMSAPTYVAKAHLLAAFTATFAVLGTGGADHQLPRSRPLDGLLGRTACCSPDALLSVLILVRFSVELGCKQC